MHLILFISHEHHCNSRNLEEYTERWLLVFTFLDLLLFTILWKKGNIYHYPVTEGLSSSLG